MNAIAQWLKEKGKIVIPKTLDTQVFDENGKSLDRRLKTAKDEQVIQLPKVDPTIIVSDLDYSTEEQLTGKRWTDGKPIYQKTLCGTSTGGLFQIDLSSLNIDKFLNPSLNWMKNENGNKDVIGDSYYGSSSDFFRYYFSEDAILKIESGSGYSHGDFYLTIQYTKTTDTASSPVAIPKVEAKHVYSTEEKVVGTWIDGKTLYEKTVVYEGALKTNTTIYQDESINEVIEVSNKYFYDTLFNKWNTEISGGYQVNIMARGCDIQGDVAEVYGDRITKCRCTIQYTKTTDTATV